MALLDETQVKEHRGLAVLVIPPPRFADKKFHIGLLSSYGTLGAGDYLWHMDPDDPMHTRQRLPAWGNRWDAAPGEASVVLVEAGRRSALTCSLATLRGAINTHTAKGAQEFTVRGAQTATWKTYRRSQQEAVVTALSASMTPRAGGPADDGALIAWLLENIARKTSMRPYAGADLQEMLDALDEPIQFEYRTEADVFAADKKLMRPVLRSAASDMLVPSVAVKSWRYEGCVKMVAISSHPSTTHTTGSGSTVSSSSADEEEDGDDSSASDGEEEDRRKDDVEPQFRVVVIDGEEEEDRRAPKRAREDKSKNRGTLFAAGLPSRGSNPFALLAGAGGAGPSRPTTSPAAKPAARPAARGAAMPSVFPSPTSARLTMELAAKKTREAHVGGAAPATTAALQTRIDAMSVVLASKDMVLAARDEMLASANRERTKAGEIAQELVAVNKRLCDIVSGSVPTVRHCIIAHCAGRIPGELGDLELFDAVPTERRQDALIAINACLGDDDTEQFVREVLVRFMGQDPTEAAVAAAVFKVLPVQEIADQVARAWRRRDTPMLKEILGAHIFQGGPVYAAVVGTLA